MRIAANVHRLQQKMSQKTVERNLCHLYPQVIISKLSFQCLPSCFFFHPVFLLMSCTCRRFEIKILCSVCVLLLWAHTNGHTYLCALQYLRIIYNMSKMCNLHQLVLTEDCCLIFVLCDFQTDVFIYHLPAS